MGDLDGIHDQQQQASQHLALVDVTDPAANNKILREESISRSLEMSREVVEDAPATDWMEQHQQLHQQLHHQQSSSRLEPFSQQIDGAVLAGIIVAVAVVAAAIVAIAVWAHYRRKRRSKTQAQPQPPQGQLNVVMETDIKTIASRQNSGGGYNGPMGFYDVDEDVRTIYGSVVGSTPPSPALSFRSAIDGPGFSRSRSGTGTSFGTVASFGSHRSRLSTTASFKTCLEEEFP
jgi:hypothetical protein